MTPALLRKELRALRPWAVMSLCIGFVEVAEALVHQPDLRPLSRQWTELGNGSGVVLWIVAYAIGTGLVSREQDDGTLAFLDGLPVSRSHVFGVKCLSTCALLVIAPSVTLLALIAQHLLSRGSLDAQLRPDMLLTLAGLQIGVIVQGVLTGAAMGMLRSLTWLVTSAVAVSLALLTERVPRSAVLNPLSLLDVQVTGAGVLVDKETLLVQLAIASLSALIAWWGFVRSGRASALANLGKRPALGAVLTALTLVASIATIAIAMRRNNTPRGQRGDESGGAGDRLQFQASPPGHTATKHYHFAYPATETKRALQLAEQADSIFERVHGAIGAPLGESIDVDASGSERNTEGTAYLGRVRIALRDNAPIVLAHETSHVVAQRLAGSEHDWLWRKARVLDEGLATYVEQTIVTDTDLDGPDTGYAALMRDRMLLAALYKRHELLVPELCDYRLLATMRDENLKYALGAGLIRAMVRVYGPGSIAKLVRAFASDSLPEDLSGLALMEATFRIAGMDFSSAIAELFEQSDYDALLYGPRLAALPRPRLRLVRGGGLVGIQALCDVERGAQVPPSFLLRIKPRRDSSYELYDSQVAIGDRPVWRPLSQIQQGEICAQVGLRIGGSGALYEPWTCLPIADAAPWDEPDDDQELDESD